MNSKSHKILLNALMLGQQLKTQIVIGRKPTFKQLLKVETKISQAINHLNSLKTSKK